MITVALFTPASSPGDTSTSSARYACVSAQRRYMRERLSDQSLVPCRPRPRGRRGSRCGVLPEESRVASSNRSRRWPRAVDLRARHLRGRRVLAHGEIHRLAGTSDFLPRCVGLVDPLPQARELLRRPTSHVLDVPKARLLTCRSTRDPARSAGNVKDASRCLLRRSSYVSSARRSSSTVTHEPPTRGVRAHSPLFSPL